MPSSFHGVLAIAAVLATGCAEHLALLERGPTGGVSPYLFWPPPEATAIWTAPAAASLTFGDVARRIASTLHEAGYPDERVYPIGTAYAHGFAVTTRLERIDDDGAPQPGAQRWAALYPDPAELKWLGQARAPRLPGRPGHYRVFLVAFTDLPIGPSERPARWNESTWMDGPDAPVMLLPSSRRVRPGFRIGVYVYEYAAESSKSSDSSDGEGRFVAGDAKLAAEDHVRRSGLSALALGAP